MLSNISFSKLILEFTPKKGGTPKRNEIVFISPTGEEIANKRQLDQYLRAHPGGPPASDFDWGTGKHEDSAALPQTSEPPKEEAPAVNEIKDGGAPAENDGFKDNRHSVNFDDGQHQPKASPVNA
ncbi:uncharacterized protein A4U43_C03F4150 [Asparagus officinalis]|uniref:MBD domain-containing protein n=1 Tax=Asparagus officinalis TaxID=4686 RepID=A0A5P1F7R6_ASPOF|nr:uncharacterized protein A4U43_C03F4150 [Asparagus officinalis]